MGKGAERSATRPIDDSGPSYSWSVEANPARDQKGE